MAKLSRQWGPCGLQALRWQAAGVDLRVVVNVSALDFCDEGCAVFVLQTLAQTGLAPEYLELELTGSCLLSSPECALATMADLRAAGVGIVLDDFGTGFSSLAYLRAAPFSTLKLDQQCNKAMSESVRDHHIVRTSIDLAHALGMQVVAEGVEADEQFETLLPPGCDVAQGHLLGRLMPPDQITRLVAAGM